MNTNTRTHRPGDVARCDECNALVSIEHFENGVEYLQCEECENYTYL